MREPVRLWALIATAYVTGIQVIHTIWTSPRLTAAMVANVLIVPIVQTGAVLLIQRLRRHPSDHDSTEGLRRFFLYWLALLITLGLASVTTGLLAFRSLDLTATIVSTLLFVPAIQSGAALLAGRRRRLAPFRWPQIGRHPLISPILWIDAVMLPAGLMFADHPLVGMAVAAVIQRRWLAIKLIVASVVLLTTAHRSRGVIDSAGRRALVAAALVVGAIGLDALVPWIFTVSESLPAPLSFQPRALLWLETYGVILTAFIVVMLRAIAVASHSSAEPGSWLRVGTVTLFIAALALMMNGFLSLQPTAPWATVALLCGTVAATCLATGVLVLHATRRPAERGN